MGRARVREMGGVWLNSPCRVEIVPEELLLLDRVEQGQVQEEVGGMVVQSRNEWSGQSRSSWSFWSAECFHSSLHHTSG